MGKQIYILNSDKDISGVIKVTVLNKKTKIVYSFKNVSTDGSLSLYYFSNDKLYPLGQIQKKEGYFEKENLIDCSSFAVLSSHDKQIFAWSGNENTKQEIAQLLNPETDTIKDEINPFTPDGFFGGGFSWTRIRGNFITQNYSIIHHIIGNNTVYDSINKAGYYYVGVKEEKDILFIAIMIPKKTNADNPFKDVGADSYEIMDDKTIYSAVCVGIDSSGEFFCSY